MKRYVFNEYREWRKLQNPTNVLTWRSPVYHLLFSLHHISDSGTLGSVQNTYEYLYMMWIKPECTLHLMEGCSWMIKARNDRASIRVERFLASGDPQTSETKFTLLNVTMARMRSIKPWQLQYRDHFVTALSRARYSDGSVRPKHLYVLRTLQKMCIFGGKTILREQSFHSGSKWPQSSTKFEKIGASLFLALEFTLYCSFSTNFPPSKWWFYVTVLAIHSCIRGIQSGQERFPSHHVSFESSWFPVHDERDRSPIQINQGS